MQPIKPTLTEINSLVTEANQRLLNARSIEEHMECMAEIEELLERALELFDEALKGGVAR